MMESKELELQLAEIDAEMAIAFETGDFPRWKVLRDQTLSIVRRMNDLNKMSKQKSTDEDYDYEDQFDTSCMNGCCNCCGVDEEKGETR